MKLVAITGCTTGVAHTLLAAEALKKTAKVMGHDIKVETHGADGPKQVLAESDIAAADAAIVASDIFVDLKRFAGKPMHAVPVADAIRKTRAVIEAALAELQDASTPVESPTEDPTELRAPPEAKQRFIVAITACPTGIAHTFMAAEALKKGAAALGHEIRVETQGSVGAKSTLTEEEIKRADAVVIAADTFVDTSRFAGKKLYQTTTKAALHDGAHTIKEALEVPAPTAGLAQTAAQMKKARAPSAGPYKHLMTGVSYMLPLVTAGGLLIAIAFAIGGIHVGDAPAEPVTIKNIFNRHVLGWALMQIGGGTAFKLYVPVLAAFIAYSIADRPGITSGLIGGAIAMTLGAGFLGGIAAGFLAGYLTKFLNDIIRLPQNLAGLKPVLILPLLTAIIVGLAMIFLIGPPVKYAIDHLTHWLSTMQQSSALTLGLILGAMMAFDTGGPVNKAAYTFAVGLIASQHPVYGPMAAVMAAGMTPPLGVALAAILFKNRFSKEEREAAPAAAVLGISFITEGAIPFAAKDPLRVIPALMIGSAVTGAIALAKGCQLVVPHGGIFVLFIPNAVQNLAAYFLAIVIGTLVTAAARFAFKKPMATTQA